MCDDQESVFAGLVEKFLDAAVEGWSDGLAFGDASPLAGRGDGAPIGAEADEAAFLAVPFAD